MVPDCGDDALDSDVGCSKLNTYWLKSTEMKARLATILTGTSLLALSPLVSAAKAEAGIPELSPEFRKCMDAVDLAAFKNTQWTACYEAELKRQDSQLNAVYQKVQKAATPELKQALLKGQRAWLAYRNTWCSYEELTPVAPGGSVNKTACLVDLTIAQITRLKNNLTDE